MNEDLATLIASVLKHPSNIGKTADQTGESLAKIIESHGYLKENTHKD